SREKPGTREQWRPNTSGNQQSAEFVAKHAQLLGAIRPGSALHCLGQLCNGDRIERAAPEKEGGQRHGKDDRISDALWAKVARKLHRAQVNVEPRCESVK